MKPCWLPPVGAAYPEEATTEPTVGYAEALGEGAAADHAGPDGGPLNGRALATTDRPKRAAAEVRPCIILGTWCSKNDSRKKQNEMEDDRK